MISDKKKPSPQQTYALVVGIEKYDAGPLWNLNGPASDAVAFVNWLLSQQVPAEHILLFLSPLEEENQSLLTDAPIPAQTATLSNIYTAITRQFLLWQGDLLYLFWGGHGMITLERSQKLFCADATQQTRQNLDLDSLLTALRSTYFAAPESSTSRFPEQVCIVDACRSYERSRETAFSLPVVTFVHGEPLRRSCEQFVLFATKPGSAAANRNDLKTGRFSEIVLQELRARNARPRCADTSSGSGRFSTLEYVLPAAI
jgi:Caspase domain